VVAAAAEEFFDTCHHCKRKSTALHILQICTTCKAAYYCDDACRQQHTAHLNCVLCVRQLSCDMNVVRYTGTTKPLPHDAGGRLMLKGTQAYELGLKAHETNDSAKKARELAKAGSGLPGLHTAELLARADRTATELQVIASALCEMACELRKEECAGWLAADDALGALKAYFAQALLRAVVLDCSEGIESVYQAHALLARTTQAQRADEQFAQVESMLNTVHENICRLMSHQALDNFMAQFGQSAEQSA
jgi:hypothetical protein